MRWDSSWWDVPRRGGWAYGQCAGHRPGRAQPSTRPSPPPRWQPSCGPAASSSFLPPFFRASVGRGEDRGLGAQLCRALAFCVSSPKQNSGGSACPERERAPLPHGVGADETQQTQALNDSTVGDCAARDARRHCRFKHACPLFGIEPMSERPLPAASQ